MKNSYNYFKLLYNVLILYPPFNPNSRNILKILLSEKINSKKNFYYKKNAIYSLIIKINNKLNEIFTKYANNNSIKYDNIDPNIDEDYYNNDDIDNKKKLKISTNFTNSIVKNVTMNYNTQLKSPTYIDENELEEINIVYKNNKIQYCSIDLLIKKICEDNSFNIEIYINNSKNKTFNFINAFIYQCFGFISYETLIYKLFDLHKYYKINNKLSNMINDRLLHLIYKITRYLWDQEIYNCSYFKSSDELQNKIINFLKENNLINQVKYLLEYKKEKKLLENNDDIKNVKSKKFLLNNNSGKKENYALEYVNSFKNYPHGTFEFNILKYNVKDIALLISYISFKNFNNLYNHLYELNPTIKKNDNDKSHLLSLVDFSNKLSNFFIEELFSYDLLTTRIIIVEKIIEILIELKNLNNFNDLLPIFSALISISIRLYKTWNQINPKLKSKFKEIEIFCQVQGCYKNIREEENRCLQEGKFFIPYLGIVTKHITFYDEGFKYVGHNGLICVEKIIVNQKEIEEFKNKLRPLRKNKFIKLENNNDINELKIVFYNMNPKDLDTLDNLSQKLEPEFTLYKKPDNKKRKTKTDLYINSINF